MKHCVLVFVILALASSTAFARSAAPGCVPSTDPNVAPCNLDQAPIAPEKANDKTSFIDKHPETKGRKGGKNVKQKDRVIVYNKGSKR